MYPGGWASRVRLKGLNAPECFKSSSGAFQSCSGDEEYFGFESYKVLYQIVNKAGKKGTIHCKMKGDGFCERDPYGRYLLFLSLRDGRDLGAEMIRRGAAWTFTRYPSDKLAEYCRSEAEAIRNRVGMWAKGRDFVKSKMNPSTRGWYFNKRYSKSHDGICSKALGRSFSKLAGE